MPLSINETTTSVADLVSKLNTFLTTGGAGNPGWTADRHVPASGEWAISKDGTTPGVSVEVAFQWSTASPGNLGIYQYRSGTGAGSYNTGVAPYAQAGDSGNGAASTTNATLATARHAPLGSTPVQYWAFTGDNDAGDPWVYVVVEVSTGKFVSFGFGVLDKTNDWDGGEFCFGYRWNSSNTNASAFIVQPGSTVLLDGIMQNDVNTGNVSTNADLYVGTLRCENLPNQAVGGLWGVVMGNQTAALNNDRQSSPKARVPFLGGARGGEFSRAGGPIPLTAAEAFVPGYPVAVIYRDRVPATEQFYGPMGFMPGVRCATMQAFAAGDEIVIGADTWTIFPMRSRSATNTADTSGYAAIMFLTNA